ncbi:hypothetical protein ACCO45_004776 [Purpureocillium lilacinum]|uniref:Uncharacterized protein n=1 Tax=Purpureocillium lilacinum TaxID=33203 RepID=A0ACC4DTJ4_PURLI
MQPQEVEVRQAARRKPDISCHSCRRRKVRCDRERPRCQACEQTNQDCEYPLGPMKPGPKIGTLQRRKRKRRDDQADASAQTRRENLHSPGLVSGDGGRAEGGTGMR